MKIYFNFFAFIALAALIVFSVTACDNNSGGKDSGVNPLLEGSWYSSVWKETYTFDTAKKTFIIMKDSGAGEKGSFTSAEADFTFKTTHTTSDNGSSWTASPSEKKRAYSVSGNTLKINEQDYIKITTEPPTEPIGPGKPDTPPVGIVSPYSGVNWQTYGQYKAGMHVHTTRSDDASTPLNEMIEYHYANGYDILSITDHDVINRDWITGKDPLTEDRYDEISAGAGRSGRGMLRIPFTNEQSMGDHVLTFMADFNNAPFSTLRSNIQKAQELGGLSHINHPGRYTSDRGDRESDIKKYSDILIEFPSCVGIEVMNMADRHPNDRILWDNVLKVTMRRGINAWAFANDDAHSIGAVGNSFNMFVMPENNIDNFRSAMVNGNFYAVARVAKTELGLSFIGSGPPPRITNIAVNNNNLSITITAENADEINWIADGAQIAKGNTLTITDHLESVAYYVRANVSGPGGIAFIQPFKITY